MRLKKFVFKFICIYIFDRKLELVDGVDEACSRMFSLSYVCKCIRGHKPTGVSTYILQYISPYQLCIHVAYPIWYWTHLLLLCTNGNNLMLNTFVIAVYQWNQIWYWTHLLSLCINGTKFDVEHICYRCVSMEPNMMLNTFVIAVYQNTSTPKCGPYT